MTTDTPRVYVACLAAYNAGKLHGKWVDAVDADTIQEAIAEVIKTSPEQGAEEHAFHDYEGFAGADLGEYASVDTIAELGAAIETHGEIIAKLWAHRGTAETVAEAVEYFEENYQGAYRSIEEYAESYFEDSGELANVPEFVRYHIDWEGVARDLDCGGDIFTIEHGGETHVFWNR